jgi:hypothetical protein
VYGGLDPITKQRIRFRKTVKTEVAAQIALGKLLEQVLAGKEPESGATVGQLLDAYVPIAEWDVSARGKVRGVHPADDPPGARALESAKGARADP